MNKYIKMKHYKKHYECSNIICQIFVCVCVFYYLDVCEKTKY